MHKKEILIKIIYVLFILVLYNGSIRIVKMNTYQKILKLNNLKATHQRLSILGCIDDFGHIDIDFLYTVLLKKSPSLSKATLYRNINDLIASSIIKEVKLPGLKQQYEIKKSPHIHLLCKSCNSVKDLSIDMSLLHNSIANSSSFKIEESFIVIKGVCSKCSAQQ